MGEPVIRVEGLGKRYRIGERERYLALRDALVRWARAPLRALRRAGPDSEGFLWALKDVSFEVPEGEVLGIIGRNGAGKTTLLKILARVTSPTEGRAVVRGRVGSLLEVGTGFHPELTGRENVYLSGAILGMSRREIDRRFEEIVDFAGVERFIDTPLKRYSAGMQTRLAFAVAAHLEPDILLVDEVLAVGDLEFQRKCLGKMGEVARQGRTVILVSHNMQAVRSLCPRVIWLEAGRIATSGSAHEIVAAYLDHAATTHTAPVETERLARPRDLHPVAPFRIVQVALCGDEASPVLGFGGTLSVHMEFQVGAPVEEVVLGWAVHAGAIRVFECSSVDGFGPIRLEPGAYVVESTIHPNPLMPGVYSLHVGARCARGGLDWLPDVLFFTVDDPMPRNSLWLEERSGLVSVTAKWTGPETLHRPPGRPAPPAAAFLQPRTTENRPSDPDPRT